MHKIEGGGGGEKGEVLDKRGKGGGDGYKRERVEEGRGNGG